MTGDLAFAPGRGVAFPGGALLGDAALDLRFGGAAVCLEPAPAPACGDVTGVAAGFGLLGGGSAGELSLDVDDLAVQRRISLACDPGAFLAAVGRDGAPACAPAVTRVDAGEGLAGGPVTGEGTLRVDTGLIQRRVAAACAPGSAIRAIAGDGSVACEADDTGLAARTCEEGFVVSGIDDAGQPECGVDPSWTWRPAPRGHDLVVVDAEGDVGVQPSLTIGADGLPVIAYHANGTGDLKVARCGNLRCSAGNTITTVDAAGDVGEHTSIAIGVDGNPVIAYYDASAGDLKLAACRDPACATGAAIVTLDAAGNVGQHASLAIGVDGGPIVAYHDAGRTALKVAHCGDPACAAGTTITTLDTNPPGGDVGRHASIAIYVFGRPMVAYANRSIGLVGASCTDLACTSATKTVLRQPYEVTGVSLAVGHDGVAWVAWVEDGATRVGSCGTRCDRPITSPPSLVSSLSAVHPSAAFLPDGRLAVAHHHRGNAGLGYERCILEGCSGLLNATIEDLAGVVGVSPSMAIGPDGLPVIAHYDATAGDLRVAHLNNPFGLANWWRRG